ncbi:Nephrocystin-3, partial [Durusdinium trenchii]
MTVATRTSAPVRRCLAVDVECLLDGQLQTENTGTHHDSAKSRERMRRTSLGRSLGRRLSRRRSSSKKKRPSPPEEVLQELARSKHVVRFQGVSLAHIRAILDEVRSGGAAPGVRVLVAKRDLAKDVWAGRAFRDDGFVPYRKSGELQGYDEDDVEERPREQWTIADVCDFVIIPSVTEGERFYTEILPSKDVGEPFQGAFVSQARSCRFGDLVAALEQHFAGRDFGTTFIWLDLFCANQPRLLTEDESVAEERAALLTSGFHLAIEWFDERLFFFDSWSKPKPLTRAWCIWEIFGAIQAGKAMTVIYPPGEEDQFIEALSSQSASHVTQAIAEMQPQEADCFSLKDLEMIRSAVESSVGWSRLKSMVVAQVLAWLHETTERLAKDLWGEETEANARFFNHAGMLMGNADKQAVALKYYERSREIRVKVHGDENHPDVASTLMNMAIIYEVQGDLRKALETYQWSLDIFVAAYGTEDHPDVAITLMNMANVYQAQGDLRKALETFQRSLDIKVAVYGTEDHPSVAMTLMNMANVYQAQGDLRKALETYQRSLDIKVAAYGTEDHPEVATTLMNMAIVYESQGDLRKALETYQRSLDITVAAYGTEDHLEVAGTLTNMAIVYQAQGDLRKALEMYQRSLDIAVAANGNEDHHMVATTLGNMAIVYETQGDLHKALETYQRSLDIFVAVFGTEDHPEVARTLGNMAIVYKTQGDLRKALETFQRSLEIKVAVYGTEDHPSVALAQFNMALCLKKMGDLTRARDLARKALRTWQATDAEEALSDVLRKFVDDVAPLETTAQQRERHALLENLRDMLNAWVLRKLEEKHVIFDGEEGDLAGRLFVSGSYRLGVNTRGSDIDSICTIPVPLSREDFFSEDDGFVAMLRKRAEVTYVNPVVGARVPIIEVVWNDIELDVLCAVVQRTRVPQKAEELLDDSILVGMDEVMPIITPAYPCMNSSYTVSKYTLRIMVDEFARGKKFMTHLRKRNDEARVEDPGVWGQLFEPSEFFVRYNTYIVVKAACPTVDMLNRWGGWVEARIRRLSDDLDRFSFDQIYPFPKKFEHQGVVLPFDPERATLPEDKAGNTEQAKDTEESKTEAEASKQDPETEEVSESKDSDKDQGPKIREAAFWYLGIKTHPIHSARAGPSVDLSAAAAQWSHNVKKWDERQDGMDVEVLICKWKQLPNDPDVFPAGKAAARPVHRRWMAKITAQNEKLKKQVLGADYVEKVRRPKPASGEGDAAATAATADQTQDDNSTDQQKQQQQQQGSQDVSVNIKTEVLTDANGHTSTDSNNTTNANAEDDDDDDDDDDQGEEGDAEVSKMQTVLGKRGREQQENREAEEQLRKVRHINSNNFFDLPPIKGVVDPL